jgi:hypothetical protein
MARKEQSGGAVLWKAGLHISDEIQAIITLLEMKVIPSWLF